MNPEIKRRWVEALRSGDYKQGRRKLRSGNDEYCCLGVLCDLAVKDGVAVTVTGGGDFSYFYDSNRGVPPSSVKDWAGARVFDYYSRLKGCYLSLTYLNDTEELSFEEIADIIEKEDIQ